LIPEKPLFWGLDAGCCDRREPVLPGMSRTFFRASAAARQMRFFRRKDRPSELGLSSTKV
jgi:hypothetical protein